MNMSNALRTTGGVILVLIGLIAMPLPVLPGIPIVAAGIALLGANHPAVRACRARLEKAGVKVFGTKALTPK